MKSVRAFALAIAVIAAPHLANAAPGYTPLNDESRKDRPLTLSIWYPSNDAASQEIGGNAVFAGTAAAINAAVPTQPLPLIVVSHGGLRSAEDSGAWLSAALAQAGAIVVEVNAPRPQSASAATREIWGRPQDISRALDMMMNSPTWKDRIDQRRISTVGFALGGTAALMGAGEKMNADLYAQSCASGHAPNPDCAWYAAQDVDLATVDFTPLQQPLRDSRITSAIAIAPEYLAAFDPEASTRNVPVLLISLSGDAALPTDASPDTLALNVTLSDAFAVCTEAGPEILREDGGDEMLCGQSQASRLAAHGAMVTAIRRFLGDP
ncbi:hypothetical protein [Celeribacter baekdonensis]|uniref:alpha/beta hydrolase family protein n=1 Tax=Celeribacter baekdonensis TaxID=875171 RepID=UPI0030D75FA5